MGRRGGGVGEDGGGEEWVEEVPRFNTIVGPVQV